MKNDVTFPFYAKASLVFLALFAFVGMLFLAQSIIVPIIYSTLLAILISPLVDFLVRRKVNRSIAIIVTVLVVIGCITTIIALLIGQLIQFSDSFPLFIIKIYALIDQIIFWVSNNFGLSTYKINAWINTNRIEMLNNSGQLIGQTLQSTGNLVVVLFLVPVYIFMILYYKPILIEFIHMLFAKSNSEVNDVLSATKSVVQSYLIGLLFEVLLVATLNSISLLVIGVQYAILFGVVGAICNIIPYVGGMIGVTLPVLLALANLSLTHAIMVIVTYLFIQFLDNNVIIPRVVAFKVQINGLVSIIVILIGGAMWGLGGMFLSIPLTAIIKVLFDHIEGFKPWGYLLGNRFPTLVPKPS